MSGVFGKNIQNLGGGSVGLGLSPAVANINMANNSIINLNQINGQTFPAVAGTSGQILHIDALGSMYWTLGAGATGPTGPPGPAQFVGGLCGQITFNYDICGDGVGESVGDAGLTYDWCAQVTNICAARILRNLSVGGNANVVGTISSGAGENWIGNVKLSAGSISNQINTTNNIGAWTLNSNSFYSTVTTITASGWISTPATISSSIAGVFMSNTTLSAGNSTIGGLGLSNSLLTASGMTVNGTASITSATTISGLLTVSAVQVQTTLNVSGLGTISNLTVLGSLSANSVYSTTTIGAGGALNISGLATISAAQIQNALNVSGLGSISNLAVQSSLSANTVYSTTTIGAGGALNVSGLATISGVNVLSNLSVSGAFSGTTANLSAITGLSNINLIPIIANSTNSNILFGTGIVNLCGTNIVALGSTAALNNSGANLIAVGTSAATSNTGANLVAIGSNAGNSNIGNSNVFIGATAGQNNSGGSDVIGIGMGAAFLNTSSKVIAIGSNAGRSNEFSNTIFLGNTEGYSGPSQANSLTVYSTNVSIPFLFGDLSGRQLGIGKTPSAALDVTGSGIFSGSVTANSAVLQTCSVSGGSTLGSLTVSGAANVSGLTTLSSTIVVGTLSATTLYAPTTNTITLSVAGLTTLSHATVQNTLSASFLFSSNSTITTLSATTLSVSGTLTNTTLNICGLATISGASITNTLTTSNIISTIGTVTTLSVATFSVSALSTLSNVNVTNTISAVNLFSSNGVINTLSAVTANISGAFSVSGVSTLSNVNVQNTLSSVNLFSSNGLVSTFSAATANVSGTLGVSGLSTLSNVNVQNTLSSSYIFSTNAVMTGLSATRLFAGSLTVSGTTTFPDLSGLTTFNGIPILLNTVSKQICFGVNTGVRGTDVIALGLSAAWKNSGLHVTGIGCNALTTNSGTNVIAIGDDTGSSNVGGNVIAIGQVTGWSNIGSGVIAVGNGACTTNSGAAVIAIGSNAAWSNEGSNMIGIGTNAGQFNKGNSGIFIGRDAGSNNTFSNALVLGNNPSGAPYVITRPNTFLVYSTVSTAPFLQGDMSGILFGIGKVPTTNLDVSGNALITRNLTVSGTATLSSAILTNLNVSGTTTLSALTTSSFGGAGLTTLSSLLVQNTISSSNVYISGTTLGLKLETNVPLTMNSMFSNQGTNILGGTSVTTLNSLTWPTGTQAVGSVLTICAGATSAYWAVPGAVSLSGWWNVAPTATLNMNNNGITNLPSINGTQINLNSTYDFIGIGRGALSGSIGGSNIVAIGVSAGIGSTGTNVIYLGTNPGGTHPYSNWFTVYSTTSGLPFLQGDMANMRLGIGKTPLSALDVSGSAFVSQSLNVSGLTTLSNITSTTLSASSIYSSGTINSSGTATLNAVSILTTLGVTGTSTLGTTGTGALTASSITTPGTLGVTGQTNLTSAVLSSTLNVTGVSTLGRVNAGDITGTSLTTAGTLGVTGTSTLGTTNAGALTVTGTSSLGTTTASTLTATNLVAQGTLNAVGATSTLGATTVNTTLNVCGAANLSSAVLSQNLTVCGQTLFKNLSFTSLNSLTWAPPSAGSTVLSVDSTAKALSWVSLTTIGLQNWAQSVANSTLSLQGYGLAGITTFNNISAVFVSASAQVGLGLGVLANNPASNIVAFGTNAGAVINPAGFNIYSNNMFLGSNPGGSSNVSNSLVVYSQTAGSPLIYGELSKNQVTIAGQTNTEGYTLNVNGSAQASRFASPAASSNSIGGVTMSNSILTVGTVCNVTNLNGLLTKFDSAAQVIFIGRQFGSTPLPAGSLNVFLGQFAGANYVGVGTVGIGDGAGGFSTGSGNICIGGTAGNSSTGSSNNFIGNAAGYVSSGSFVNALGISAAWSNAASYVDAIGANAGYQNAATGSNLVAIGSNAGVGNRGAFNIYIGAQAGNGSSVTAVINAIVIGGGAGVAGGVYAVGTRSIMIGTGSTAGGSDSIAIGTASLAGNSANIAIGANAGYNGPSSIVIGSNTGSSPNTSATNVIAIGTNAASNIPALNNTIYIGSNAGYNPTTSNTLVVQSLVSTAPTLQADLANRRLGVGCAPTYSLDVQVTSAGSSGMRIARNDTSNVSAGLFLEAGIMSGFLGATSGNTTLVSFATRGAGGGTVVQSLMSIYEGGDYGLSIKAGNTVSSATVLRVTTEGAYRVGVGTVSPTTTLDVSGTFNVSGATTLSGVALNVLNGVRWPTTAGAPNTQLVISATGQASWAAPGTIDSASWSSNPALQAVNMAGYGLTSLASINGLTTTIASTNNQIGIGANVLTNNTAANVVAFGSNAGSNATGDSTWSNCVYLGANPGTPANGANTFLVYSTTAGTPAIQVNMQSRRLGVGMVPANALDVSGAARISTTLTSIGNVTIGTIASPSNYSLNINGATDTGGMIAFYNTAATPQPQFGIGFDKAAGGFALKGNLGGTDFTGTAMFVTAGGLVGVGTITPAYTLDVAGQINTSVRFSSPSTSSNSIGGITLSNGALTAGATSLGNTTAGTFSASSLTAAGGLSVTGTSTLAGVTATSITNTGLSILANVSAATISGTLIASTGAINAATTVTAQTSVSTSFVNTTTLSAAGAMTVNGTFTTNSVANLSGRTTLTGLVGVGASNTSTFPMMVTGTLYCTSNIISTLNVAGVASGTSITLTPDNATTYYSLTTTTGTTLTLTLPSTAPPQGTYWVLKNNAAVNYTLTSTNGVFNAGSNSYYLQAGIGITLAYSGTQANGSPAYYTF